MSQPTAPKKKSKLTRYILISMVVGIFVGYICHNVAPDPKAAKEMAGYFSILTDIFLRLIKMIIAPLVFSTLVVGVAHMGDTASIGRIGLKTMGWFIVASFISLLLGMLMVNLLRPGENLGLPLPETGASTNLKVASLSLKEFITHLIPKSVFEAMATNEILQIVVFSIFFGIAIASFADETARTLIQTIEEVSHVMLKITGYVMYFAPVAVFAAMAATVTTQGLGVLVTYAKFMGGFYLACWCCGWSSHSPDSCSWAAESSPWRA